METFEMSSASVSDEQEEILSTASVEIDVDFSQESNVGQLDIDDTSRRPSQTAVETTEKQHLEQHQPAKKRRKGHDQ